jgi:hypothetical protein
MLGSAGRCVLPLTLFSFFLLVSLLARERTLLLVCDALSSMGKSGC